MFSFYKKLSALCVLLAMLAFAQISFADYWPRGNYTHSCHACHMNRRNVLRCACRMANGTWTGSALKVGPRCNFVQNLNGQLTCTHRSRRPYPGPRPQPRRNRKVVVSAGPIWNSNDANYKCPRVCHHFRRWDGKWWTTQQGINSVCECIR